MISKPSEAFSDVNWMFKAEYLIPEHWLLGKYPQQFFVFLIGVAQSKEIIFQPSKEPAFVTVPGNGFADPFSIVPGTWIACIKAEGVLLVRDGSERSFLPA